MHVLTEVMMFVLPLMGLVVLALAMWGLGRWLRRLGYGEKLDRIDAKVSKTQHATRRIMSPLGGAMIGICRGLSKVPLLGSKRSSAMLDEIETLSQKRQ